MGIGALDTDSVALATRLELQHRLSKFDLNAWIFSNIPAEPGQKWLDLGCGRGEQSLPLAQRVGARGRVTSVDLSEESLASVRAQADALGVGGRIATVRSSLNDIDAALTDGPYDRAVGSYSLYYAGDPEALFASIARVLADDGALFFCGPAYDNNMELRRLMSEAQGADNALRPTKPSLFMEEEAPNACRRLFSSIATFRFENPVTFREVGDLVAYWRSHNLFDPSCNDRFLEVAEQAFEERQEFINTKRGVGILARKADRS